jgi:hypothetical protein
MMTARMKIRSLFCLFLLLSSASMYAQQIAMENAVEYNDYIIGEQLKIAGMMKVVQIDRSIVALQSLAPYDGSHSFRDAAIKLFTFYRSMAHIEYRKLAALVTKKEYTDADIAAINEIIVSITNNEKPLDEIFLKEQKEFAAMHSFTVVPAETVSEKKGPVPQASVVDVKVAGIMNAFMQCMQKKDQHCMKTFMAQDFLIRENLIKKEYTVNYYVPDNYLIQHYDDSSGIVTIFIWWGDYLTVHKLTFKLIRKEEQYFILPSRFQNNYLDPWQSVQTNVNKSAK